MDSESQSTGGFKLWEKFKFVVLNWKTIVLILTTLSSWIGYQESVLADKEQEIQATREQVTTVANHLTKTIVIEKQSETRPCNCKKEIQEHIKEFH